MGKLSRLEAITVLLCTAVLAFSAGWFLRGASVAEPVRIEPRRNPPAPALAVTPPASAACTAAIATPVRTAPVTAPAPAGKVNINTADSETLQTLPGIGEKRAEDIITYRQQYGPFRIPEDLTKVSGIGEGILEDILDLITTGDGT